MDRYIRTMGELSVVFSALPAAEPEGELFLLRPGGAALLTALALRQFGVPCALGGTVRSDALGSRLLRDAEKAGMDTGDVVVCKGQTTVRIQDGRGRKSVYAPDDGTQAETEFRSGEQIPRGGILFSAVSCCTTKEEKRDTNSSHGRRPKGIAFWC